MKDDIHVNVYVVDAKPDYTTELLQALQSHLDVKVRSFVAGEQFIEYVRTHGVPHQQVHIAVVAFRHTSAVEYVMNGLEILETLQRIAPGIKVVMVGQQEDLEFGAQARHSGAVAVVEYTQCTSLQLSALVLRIVSPMRRAIRRRQVTSVAFQLLVSLFIFSVCLFYILYQ